MNLGDVSFQLNKKASCRDYILYIIHMNFRIMLNQILDCLGLGILLENNVKQENNESKIQDNGYLWRD